MKTSLILFFAILFSIQLSQAQEIGKEGYILTIRGDTLKGFISVKFWESEDIEIYLRDNNNKSSLRRFNSETVTEFKIEDELYFLKEVDLDNAPLSVNTLSVQKETDNSFERRKVFLNLLVNGTVSLYYYRDSRDHYFIENQLGINELKSRELVEFSNGRYNKIDWEKDLFKFQLDNLIECKSLEGQKAKYSRKSLMSFVQECNAQENNTLSYIQKDYKPKRTRRVSLLANSTNLYYKTVNRNDEVKLPFGNELGYSFSFETEINNEKKRPYRSFFYGLKFSSFNSNADYNITKTNKSSSCNRERCLVDVYFKDFESQEALIYYLNIDFGLRYRIGKTKKTIIQMGASKSLIIFDKTNSSYEERKYSYVLFPNQIEPSLDTIQPTLSTGRGSFIDSSGGTIGVFIGIGYELKNVELRLISSTSSVGNNFSTKGIEFGISYKL